MARKVKTFIHNGVMCRHKEGDIGHHHSKTPEKLRVSDGKKPVILESTRSQEELQKLWK